MRNHSILVSIPSKFLKKKKGLLSFVSFIFAACSSCSEEESLMVPNPDPKQYWNNWKNDMSSFSETNQ